MCETEDSIIDTNYEYDPQTESYHFTHDFANSHSFSMSVIMALETVADSTARSLEQPLYDIINPEGIDALFEPKRSDGSYRNGQVRFSLDEFDVRVYSHGEIIVQLREDER